MSGRSCGVPEINSALQLQLKALWFPCQSVHIVAASMCTAASCRSPTSLIIVNFHACAPMLFFLFPLHFFLPEQLLKETSSEWRPPKERVLVAQSSDCQSDWRVQFRCGYRGSTGRGHCPGIGISLLNRK